ncbi:MAG: amino acid-binding protein [Clostridia bacterium]|nr:amino acid-binding protein [Clostridia bacterium]
MSVKQISVFIENKTGKLAEVTRFIAENNINMKALSVADTHDFGILRIICENHDSAVKVLKDGGFVVAETEVLAVEIPDTPGALAEILEVLVKADIAVEYTYAFLSVKNIGHAYMIFRVDNNANAKTALVDEGFNVVNHETLF